MLVEINKDGMLIHARVRNARSPAIERGKQTAAITGIVVHQTDANTVQSSLNSYRNPKANGAHLLIDETHLHVHSLDPFQPKVPGAL